jgi:centrosomal protein CEP104
VRAHRRLLLASAATPALSPPTSFAAHARARVRTHGPPRSKLGFQVVFASGEDADYPATELNFHSPQTKGWQSPRFCEFPCEIGLAFLDGAASISLVQLLSHQHKIATRVELFTGTGADYMSAHFPRLGYLSLDSNEKSGFKARELKSVYLKARGQFLKLLLHRCYANPLNLFSQVGLIAINALGQPAQQQPGALPAGGANGSKRSR